MSALNRFLMIRYGEIQDRQCRTPKSAANIEMDRNRPAPPAEARAVAHRRGDPRPKSGWKPGTGPMLTQDHLGAIRWMRAVENSRAKRA